jgi:hypothetical protein
MRTLDRVREKGARGGVNYNGMRRYEILLEKGDFGITLYRRD